MKKIIALFLIMFVSITVNAQTYKYNTTDFAYRTVNNNGYWTNWSDWEKSSMLVVISLDREKINIYSATPQEYDIYEYGEDWKSDNQGGSTWTLKCVNEDGLRCDIRLRKQNDGQLQLYVDFSDASWVYNIYQKN